VSSGAKASSPNAPVPSKTSQQQQQQNTSADVKIQAMVKLGVSDDWKQTVPAVS
jgi:hypothetical protein